MCFFGQGHEKKMLSFSRNNESFLHPDTSYAVFSSASNDFLLRWTRSDSVLFGFAQMTFQALATAVNGVVEFADAPP